MSIHYSNGCYQIKGELFRSKVFCSVQLYSEAMQSVLRDHGPRGFFKGLGAASLRAFPSNGALFLGYEYSQRMLNNNLF